MINKNGQFSNIDFSFPFFPQFFFFCLNKAEDNFGQLSNWLSPEQVIYQIKKPNLFVRNPFVPPDNPVKGFFEGMRFWRGDHHLS